VALAGTGTAVSITPLGPLTFANQLVGTKSASKTIVFQNFGPTPVSMSRTITGNTADFVTTGCTATSLSPGQRCTVTIWFQPRAAGTRTISVAFTYGDPASPTTIVASGFATAPVATPSPSRLEFRTPYQVASARDLTITNTGTAPLTLNSIALGGTSAGQFAIADDACGAPRILAPTEACVVTVQFLAQTTATVSATLNIGVAAPAASRSVTLIGYITLPTYIIAPRPLTFPDTTVGSTRVLTTWVQNIGTLPLTINGFSFSGSNPGSFSETDGCPATLPAGAACAVNVTFAPATAGAQSATMRLDAGAPAASLSVSLAGNGVEALAAQ
jgi:hypothetical protein